MLCVRVSFSSVRKSPDDCLHDIYLIVFERIRTGKVREYAGLAGYVRCIAQSVVANITRSQQRERRALEASGGSHVELAAQENHVYGSEQKKILNDSLKRLKPEQSELLTRRYLLGQTKQQICPVMSINSQQYMNLRAKAKNNLRAVAQRKLVA